jgi:hypothetical protein
MHLSTPISAGNSPLWALSQTTLTKPSILCAEPAFSWQCSYGPVMVPLLRHINPGHKFVPCILKFQFNVTLSSLRLDLSVGFFFLRFQNYVRSSHLQCVLSRPYLLRDFITLNTADWKYKLWSSLFFGCLLFFKFRFSHLHFIFGTPICVLVL